MSIYIDKDLCKGCGLCIDACPVHVYEIKGETNHKGFAVVSAVEPDNCVKCKICEKICPDLALFIE
jgi:2-oxoglutarate ferredoxin oxidoreductase subunit delta